MHLNFGPIFRTTYIRFFNTVNINFFLKQSFEEAESKKKEAVEAEDKPDQLTQLVTMFSRKATTEHTGVLGEDALYMKYAEIMGKSCGEEEEEGGDEGGGDEGNEDPAAALNVSLRLLLYYSAYCQLSRNPNEIHELCLITNENARL